MAPPRKSGPASTGRLAWPGLSLTWIGLARTGLKQQVAAPADGSRAAVRAASR